MAHLTYRPEVDGLRAVAVIQAVHESEDRRDVGNSLAPTC